MKPRQKRLALILGGLATLGVASWLVLSAFQENLVFFYSPSQVANNEAPQGKAFRIGGLVEEGSVKRQPDGVTVAFNVTDTAKVIPVHLQGHPSRPLQGRQGRGGAGQARTGRHFTAHEVLAKHDENYMPPEAAHAVEQAPQGAEDGSALIRGKRTLDMIPEIGHFALILALLITLIQAVLPIAGAARGDRVWMAVARPAARAQAFFVTFAWLCLVYSFVTSDFSVLNVAQNSNSQLPLQYKVAASWGSHEGSLLLWVLMLAWWTFAVAVLSRHLPEEMSARVIGVQGLISFGFLLFMLTTSDPFDRLFPAAADGRDLNPLLQDPGMVFHPPLLYMGYVGFSVAFSFAIAALLGGRLDATWARWSRPWTTMAWVFLTLGIALGSWWAYYELGWGGWWFWDPVENASFMPWLVGTALIHSLAVTEKRGSVQEPGPCCLRSPRSRCRCSERSWCAPGC
jgi:cytochrome c-type biogenesis protein CcmE/ABC-type amino acid transport substrate-binding protein